MNIFNKNVGHSDLFSWSTLVYNGYSLEWHGEGGGGGGVGRGAAVMRTINNFYFGGKM